MKKIFITGGFGYIGSKLAMEALSKGYSVFLYDSLVYKQDHNKILKKIESKKTNEATCQFIIEDTRNIGLLEQSLKEFKPDYFFHLAELVGIHVCNDNPEYTKEINSETTKRVVDLAEKLKIPFVYNSTSSVYGNQKEMKTLDENVKLPEATDNYSKYKLEVEKYITSRKETNPEFKVIIFRPATIFGVAPRIRLELLPNHFTYCALSKRVIKISEPNSYRAIMDIDDFVNSYFKIMEKDNWPKLIYNIGHHNLSKIQIAKEIQSVIDCKIDMIDNLGDTRNLQIDSSAFVRDFNFKPQGNLKTSIIKVKDWLGENLVEIEKSDYLGIINAPINQWLKMI